jgi:hypothetical protein
VTKATRATKNIVASLTGGYALYQYPLVWQYVGERTQWMFVDVESKVGTPPLEELQPDNWIPFKLNVQSKITADGLLRDGITEKLREITKDEFRHPLLFLKDSMCHTDLRTRFLLQFWIVEYFADKYSGDATQDNKLRTFVNELEKLIADKQPAYLDYFKSRKGELLRLTLAEKVQGCFRTMRIKYDDPLFKRAKAVRDSLSHAGEFKEDELREMELYIRELVRHMLRRDLELTGYSIDSTNHNW